MTSDRLRPAARALVLDPEDRILLVRFDFPWHDRAVWAAPGGGLEPGESPEVGIRRELSEEIGLERIELGPIVWFREARWQQASLLGPFDGQRETFFLVRTPSFEPRPRFSEDELRAEWIGGMAWWTLDELDEADAVHFAPRDLPQRLRRLLDEGPAAEPPTVGF